MVSRKGEYSFVKLGKDEEIFQFEIPHGTWFAAEVKKPGSFALVGCTVSPGFDYEDLEIGNRDKLIKNFPAHKEIIQKFTR
jgi:predicted cupin superfamily sugar epimerase